MGMKAGKTAEGGPEDHTKVLEAENESLRRRLDERTQEYEDLSMSLALDLAQAFEVLNEVAGGNLSARAREDSENELIAKLGQVINKTTENIKEAKGAELRQIFDGAASAMRVIDLDFNVIRVNRTMEDFIGIPAEEAIGRKCHEQLKGALCSTPQCPLERIRKGEDTIKTEVEKEVPGDRKALCLLQATPYRGPGGELAGIIEDFRDISDLKKVEADLEANSLELALGLAENFEVLRQVSEGDYSVKAPETSENELLARLGQTINKTVTAVRDSMQQLSTANERMVQVQEIIVELSTPVVQIWEGVLALPLIGVLDSQRAQQAMETLLEKIIEEKARMVIVDITGVPLVDSLVANYLAQTMAAVKLIGADGVLTGISANVAQTLVKLGVDIGSIVTRSNLAEGLQLALKKMGMEVRERG